jgi:hypothetical protein
MRGCLPTGKGTSHPTYSVQHVPSASLLTFGSGLLLKLDGRSAGTTSVVLVTGGGVKRERLRSVQERKVASSILQSTGTD